MRKIVLVVGAVLVLVAAVLLVRAPGEALGSLWASIDTNTLVGFGALIEKKVDPDLWSGVILPVLDWPSWIVPLVLGAIMVLAARPWKRRDRRRGARA